MPDLTPDYLDALKAKAKAAEWEADGPARSFACDCGIGNATHDYIAANSPDVTLALIARIRELEDGHVNLGTQFVPEAVRMAEGWQELRVKLEARIRAADRLYAVADDLGLEGVSEEMAAALAAYQETAKSPAG